MPRTGENIYRRKDGRWEGRYIKGYEGNKARYGYIYGKTYREVKANILKVQTENQMLESTMTSDEESYSFEVLAEEWFETSRTFFKESTCVKYKNLLRCYIIPNLGDFAVREVTDDTIFAFANRLLVKGGVKETGLSTKSVSDTLSILRMIRKYAINKNLNVNYTDCTLPVKQKQKPFRVFSMEEQRILCSYLHANRTLRNLGILLCLFTGLRVGELCALKWEDISLADRTLYIHRTMQRLHVENGDGGKTQILISSPKSNSSVRVVPLPDVLIKELCNLRKSDDSFFLTGERARYIEPRTMQNHFKAVLRECQINDANFHTLRHTFATRCVEVAFDTKSLSEILGHANVNITLNRYVHPTMTLKRENMDRLSALFPFYSPSDAPSGGIKKQEKPEVNG
ncbi:MAG: site-specific integrase [Lachnospiraceae bacterium]|nr:site-specific integrase [Lachnospiraceae bacterium]